MEPEEQVRLALLGRIERLGQKIYRLTVVGAVPESAGSTRSRINACLSVLFMFVLTYTSAQFTGLAQVNNYSLKFLKAGISVNFTLIFVKSVYYWNRVSLIRELFLRFETFHSTQKLPEYSLRLLEREHLKLKVIVGGVSLLIVVNAFAWDLFPLVVSRPVREWASGAAPAPGLTQVVDNLPTTFLEIVQAHPDWKIPVYLFEMISGYLASVCVLVCELLVLTLVLMLRLQYKVLLRYLRLVIDAKPKAPPYNKLLGFGRHWESLRSHRQLAYFIQDHQRLLLASKNMSRLMSPILGSQLLVSIMSIGFVIFNTLSHPLVHTGSVYDYVVHYSQNLIYSAMSFTTILIYCWFSTSTHHSNHNIHRTIATANWHLKDLKFQKKLLLVIARSQANFHFSASDMMSVDMATCAQVIQLSYSYYSVLKTKKQD